MNNFVQSAGKVGKRSSGKLPFENAHSNSFSDLSDHGGNDSAVPENDRTVSSPQNRSFSAGGLSPLSKTGASQMGGPTKSKKDPEVGDPKSMDTDKIIGKSRDGKVISFMSTKSRALFMMVENASDEQLRTDSMLRKMILDDYKESMAKRLETHDNDSYEGMFSAVFRANDVGELVTYNRLMKASLPEGMVDEMMDMNNGTPQSVDAALGMTGTRISQDPVMQEVLTSGMDAFGDSKHFSGKNLNRRSGMLMNNVMLRGIAPQMVNSGMEERSAYADQHMTPGGGKAEHNAAYDQGVTQGVGKQKIAFSAKLQAAVNEGPGKRQSGEAFRQSYQNQWEAQRPEYTADFGSESPGTFREYTMQAGSSVSAVPQRQGLRDYLLNRFSDKKKYGDGLKKDMQTPSGSTTVKGLVLSRMIANLAGVAGGDMTNEQIGDMYEKLLTGGSYAETRRLKDSIVARNRYKGVMSDDDTALLEQKNAELEQYTPDQVADMDKTATDGMIQLKGIYFSQLKNMRDKYGVMGSQLHPEDFLSKLGPEFFDYMCILQDTEQLIVSAPSIFDFEHNEDDKEFKLLHDYYISLYNVLNNYISAGATGEDGGLQLNQFNMDMIENGNDLVTMMNNEGKLGGPALSDEQLTAYKERLRKKLTSRGMKNGMFGRFKSTAV